MLNLGYDTHHIQAVGRPTLKVFLVELAVTSVFAKCFVSCYESMRNNVNVSRYYKYVFTLLLCERLGVLLCVWCDVHNKHYCPAVHPLIAKYSSPWCPCRDHRGDDRRAPDPGATHQRRGRPSPGEGVFLQEAGADQAGAGGPHAEGGAGLPLPHPGAPRGHLLQGRLLALPGAPAGPRRQ